MTNIEKNIPLAPLTTMKTGGYCSYLAHITQENQIPELLDWAKQHSLPTFIIGSGSNVVFSDAGFPGLVMKMEIPGINCIENTEQYIDIEVGAGVIWDDFVKYTVNNGFWGIENMSLIPGTVGAVAVQNVGAYGQDSKRVIQNVRVYDISRRCFTIIQNKDCQFRYRKSIFNTEKTGRYIIVSITFRLTKKAHPIITRQNLKKLLRKRYGKLFSRLVYSQHEQYTQQQIRDTVIHLRSCGKALPVPESDGNSGSFFQIQTLPHNHFWSIVRKAIRTCGPTTAIKIASCRLFLSNNEGVMIPPRILIQSCKATDVQSNGISLYKNNCTVIINSSKNAQAKDILNVIREVRTCIYSKLGVIIPIEPSLIGFTEEEINLIKNI